MNLVERYGSPLYVYELSDVDTARDTLFGMLPEGFEVFYAVKANPHPEIGAVLAAGGCRAEISSTGELAAAVAGGFDPAQCLYTGPGKTDGELSAAIAAGVRTFSVESPGDLAHVGAAATAHGVTARCLLRVNTASSGASTGIRMMGKPSQFGIDAETLPDVLPSLLTAPGAQVVGAHFFTMSNAADQDALLAEYGAVLELAARLQADLGLPLEFLDIGGGFSSPYTTQGSRAEYPKLRTELTALLDLHLPRWRSGTPRLAVESGRFLVGGSGTLLATVVNVKESRGKKFVILDAGINTVGGLSGLGRLLPVQVELSGEPAQRASLVGPLCTPGDTLGRDIPLPHLEIGDVISIPNVGAYGPTASLLSFLGRPSPDEVVLRDGQVQSVSRLEYHRSYQRSAIR